MSHKVEFPDVQIRECFKNILAESMLTRFDEDGFYNTAFDMITCYNKEEAAMDTKVNCVILLNGQKRLHKHAIGWKLEVLWKDRQYA